MFDYFDSTQNKYEMMEFLIQQIGEPLYRDKLGTCWKNGNRGTPAANKILISAKGPIKHNIQEMHIETAYQIHEMEVNELLEKAEMYSRTQLEEYGKVFAEVGLSEQEIKRMVFGAEITEETIKKKPLGKMLRDLERELKIFN